MGDSLDVSIKHIRVSPTQAASYSYLQPLLFDRAINYSVDDF